MDIKFRMLLLTLVFIGALNWGLVALNLNPVDRLSKKNAKWIYALTGISAVLLLVFSARETFLPFLGTAAFPCGVLEPKVPADATLEVTILTVPNTHILYWAAQPGNADRSWEVAYGTYHNSGVVVSNEKGEATLPIRAPGGYQVPRKTLLPHVHYRTCLDGMLGPVETVSL